MSTLTVAAAVPLNRVSALSPRGSEPPCAAAPLDLLTTEVTPGPTVADLIKRIETLEWKDRLNTCCIDDSIRQLKDMHTRMEELESTCKLHVAELQQLKRSPDVQSWDACAAVRDLDNDNVHRIGAIERLLKRMVDETKDNAFMRFTERFYSVYDCWLKGDAPWFSSSN
jgi:hypothetical protein